MYSSDLPKLENNTVATFSDNTALMIVGNIDVASTKKTANSHQPSTKLDKQMAKKIIFISLADSFTYANTAKYPDWTPRFAGGHTSERIERN